MIDQNAKKTLEDSIPDFIAGKRWFGSKGKSIRYALLDKFGEFSKGKYVAIFRLVFTDDSTESYFIPLSENGNGESISDPEINGKKTRLFDATDDPEFLLSIIDQIKYARSVDCGDLILKGSNTGISDIEVKAHPDIQKIKTEQSNTSIIIDNYILKIYRKIMNLDNPDFILPTMLWKETDFRNTPLPYGRIEIQSERNIMVGSLMRLIEHAVDGWTRFTSTLSSRMQSSRSYRDILLLEDAEKLGALTGNLHAAMKYLSRNEEGTFLDYAVNVILPGIRRNSDNIARAYSERGNIFTGNIRKMLEVFISRRDSFIQIIENITRKMAERRLMIVHGDYHLGQVLYHDGKYDVIDFEGEPMRYSSGNFVKSLPMKDVAGMIRSFDYSFAFSSIRKNKHFTDDARSKWLSEMKDNFLRSYRDSFDYDFDDDILEIFLIEKAIYELNYEINNRPDWVEIPLSFLDTRNI